MKPIKELTTAAIAVVVLTLALGVAYPLVITGISQVAFGGKADGDPDLLGKAYLIDTGEKDADGNAITRPDPKDFQTRPSATGDSATATFFANRGPNSAAARFFYRDGVEAYIGLEGRYTPGLTAARVPIDAVTASASGVDPDISKANAAIQARRVAAVRHLPLAKVQALVKANTDGRFLAVFGEPGVNVVTLNAALDKDAA